MKRNTATRLAATAAGGLLAIGIAGPAAAHDTPAEGFNAVLHGPHHDRLVGDEGWPDCRTVSSDAGDAADELVKPGFDVWVFNATSHTFDPNPAGDLAQIRFTDGTGDEVAIAVPSGAGNPTGFAWWIGPNANPNKLAVSVPQGWTLRDGDFLVQPGPGGPLRGSGHAHLSRSGQRHPTDDPATHHGTDAFAHAVDH